LDEAWSSSAHRARSGRHESGGCELLRGGGVGLRSGELSHCLVAQRHYADGDQRA
jgi:hypothetical protein